MRKLIVTLLALLVIVPAAQAGTMASAHTTFYHDKVVHRHHHHHHHKRRHHKRHHKAATSPTHDPKPVAPTAPVPPAPYPNGPKYHIGQNQDCTASSIVPWLHAQGIYVHQGGVMEFGTSPVRAAVHYGVDCVQAAREAGYPIYLNIKWDKGMSIPAIQAFVKQALTEFGGNYFAVQIGNEEDLSQNGGYSPTQYDEIWNAVEGELPSSAVHVLAGGSPWSTKWEEQLAALHPIGADVMGFHCYAVRASGDGLAGVPALAQYLAKYKLPLGCVEMAPDLNPNTGPGWSKVTSLSQWNAEVASFGKWMWSYAYYYWPTLEN